MTIDFKKKEGFITANGASTVIHGVTVTQNTKKRVIVLQGIVTVQGVDYPTDMLAVPDHPRILGELIDKLVLLKAAKEGKSAH